VQSVLKDPYVLARHLVAPCGDPIMVTVSCVILSVDDGEASPDDCPDDEELSKWMLTVRSAHTTPTAEDLLVQ